MLHSLKDRANVHNLVPDGTSYMTSQYFNVLVANKSLLRTFLTPKSNRIANRIRDHLPFRLSWISDERLFSILLIQGNVLFRNARRYDQF